VEGETVETVAAPKTSFKKEDEVIATVKLGGLRSGVHRSRATTQKVVKKEEELATDGLKELTLEAATDLFKAYGTELIAQKRSSLAAFFSDPLIKVASGVVTFTVGSKLVADGIGEETRKIRQYFSKASYTLEAIECRVNAKEVSEYKVFTPKEQFDVMAKEFPILKEFEERFNLEIDG